MVEKLKNTLNKVLSKAIVNAEELTVLQGGVEIDKGTNLLSALDASDNPEVFARQHTFGSLIKVGYTILINNTSGGINGSLEEQLKPTHVPKLYK